MRQFFRGMRVKLIAASMTAVVLSVAVMYYGVRFKVSQELGRLEDQILEKTVQHLVTTLTSISEKRDKDQKIFAEKQGAQRRILEEQQAAQQKIFEEKQATQQRMIATIIREKGQSVATLVAKIAVEPVLYSDTLKLDGIVKAARADRQIAYLFATGKSGKVINSLGEALNIPKAEYGKFGVKPGDANATLSSLAPNPSLLAFKTPMSDEGVTVGALHVGVFRTLVGGADLGAKDGAAASAGTPAGSAESKDAQAGNSSPEAGEAQAGTTGVNHELARELAAMTNSDVAFFGPKGSLGASSEGAQVFSDSQAGAEEARRTRVTVHRRASVEGKVYNVAYVLLKNAGEGTVLGVALPMDATASANRAIGLVLLLSGGLALLVSFVVAFGAALRIARPLTALTAVTEQIAAGDLTCEVTGADSGDEIGVLAAGVSRLAENLKGILTRIRDLSTELADAAHTTAGASDRMVGGASDQKRQLEQVSESSAEITRALADVARTAAQSLESSQLALQAANEGKEKVGVSAQAMAGVSASVDQTAGAIRKLGVRSQDIGQILGVIDDIADQINLLSLNAAIEAARAGEHGRGFAVVADEVRKLAEKATRATKDIEETVKGIQTETDGAVHVMDYTVEQAERVQAASRTADESLGRIVDSSKGAVDMINVIASSTEEQSAILQSIATSMEAVVGVANDVLTDAGDVRQAAASLSKVAATLSTEVAKFKLSAK
ncbi:MAG: methyl-accepting chemotaxis protein [Deltaproteobacteria bacterium]|nr:methyl-accepting chemotaxis protein [Deltaproteobacteria bacterium]